MQKIDHQANALRWIVSKLDEHVTPYQIVGGLAAIAYGSKRALADIDLYISYQKSAQFLLGIKEHIYWGPEHQKDANWDITYLKIAFEGQKIEIGDSDNARIFDVRLGKWTPHAIDYSASQQILISQSLVNVMPLRQLLDYKAALNRDVDKQDIQELS